MFLNRPLMTSCRLALNLAAFGLLPLAGASPAAAAPLQEPTTFASANGSLSVLMIAAERQGLLLGPVKTNAWTYEVCPLPSATATACPAGTGQAGLGGVRLEVQPGDKLRVRLVNKLPVVLDADHIADNCYLANNPTNLHTHGMIVEPHRAVGPSDTYGDYVFLELDNPANTVQIPLPGGGKCPLAGQAHPGDDLASLAANYLYVVEASHPSGLNWFHPHLHGLALNQVTAGLAGILTVGNPGDECGDAACRAAVAASNIRHLILNDTQVLKGGVLKSQPDPDFCSGAPASPRQGICAGQNAGPDADYTGGSWTHTVNGQVYPDIPVAPAGDLWRIVNASGSRSYALSIVENGGNSNGNNKSVPMQLIALDGVTINVKGDDSLATLQGSVGSKATLVECPGVVVASFAKLGSRPICATSIRMMPSSRVQVRVVRPNNGVPSATAVLRTAQFDTGDTLGDQSAGDRWPAVDLASVTFAPRDMSAPDAVALGGTTAQAALSAGGVLASQSVVQVPGTDTLVTASAAGPAVAAAPTGPALQPGLVQAPTIAVTPDILVGVKPAPGCAPLAFGHRRRILFGFPTPNNFGLGYVEVDASGNEVPGTRQDILPFDPTKVSVCVPLPGGNPTYEVWELVNLTSEDHNFHIHQTRFLLLGGGASPGTTIPQLLNGSIVLHDNVPVPRPTPASNALACDGTLGPVQSGACKPSSTFVLIPFRELGDFVFHCHILEHEDGGMMARIRTVATPAAGTPLASTSVQ